MSQLDHKFLIDNSMCLLFDVRDFDYGQGGKICGAYHVPHYQVSRIEKIIEENPDKNTILVYCQQGMNRSVKICEQLRGVYPDKAIEVVSGGISLFSQQFPHLIVQ